MKNYFVYKNWLIRLVICSLFLIGTIIIMLIDKMNKIPLIIYVLFLLFVSIFTLTMIVLVLINKEKFLTKIYLHDVYFEIKNKSKVLHKVKITDIKEIRLKKEQYITFIVVDYYKNNKVQSIEIEYNKNIIMYFKTRKIDILK